MAGAADVRVFISYSRNDTDLVDRLKSGLARRGAVIWLDHEQLTPGTPNWQIAVRNGIAQATHVVYVASETAALSPYVYDEISLARGKGKPVIPFWARGTEWHDCIPLGWGLTQYTDGRGANFDAGLVRLAATLGLITGASQPAPVAPPTPRYPVSAVPSRLVGLGFRGANPNGTPAIVPPLKPIPAGPFLMGSVEAPYDDEKPQHTVEVAAFQIAKYPVTVAEYALAVGAPGGVREPSGSVTWTVQQRRPDHPVVCVSWQDAMAYIAWLRKATGQADWRLPTEAEWEKAARWDVARNTSRIYPWGDTFDKNRANTRESGNNTTSPVGSYPASDARRSGASPYGVEDMAGNVWEWTSSIFKPYKYIQSDGREDQRSTGSRTLRGGAWGNDASLARAACRLDYRWDVLYNGGFRLALGPGAGSSH